MAEAYQCDRCKNLVLEAKTIIYSTFHDENGREPFRVAATFRKTNAKDAVAELCLDCQHAMLIAITDEWEQRWHKENAEKQKEIKELF